MFAILCSPPDAGDGRSPHVLMVGKGRKTLPFHGDGARFAGYLFHPARYEQLLLAARAAGEKWRSITVARRW